MITLEEAIEILANWLKGYEHAQTYNPDFNNLAIALEVALPCLVSYEAIRQVKVKEQRERGIIV